MRNRTRIIKGIAITSKMSYRDLLPSGLQIYEAEFVYSFLKQEAKPMTSREISMQSGIERTNITRTLYDLIEANLIKVDSLKKCPITHKTVKYYICND
jgi:predicted transcriptional regulator